MLQSPELLDTPAAAPRHDFDLIAELENLTFDLGPRTHAAGLELICRIGRDVPARVGSESARCLRPLALLIEQAIRGTQQGEVVVDVSSILPDVPPSPFAEEWTPDTARHPIPISGPCSLLVSVQSTGRFLAAPPEADADLTRAFEAFGGRVPQHQESGRTRAWSFHLVVETGDNQAMLDREAAPPVRGSTVLVADDNATTRSVLEEMLSGWGVRVRAVDGGEAALAVVRERQGKLPPFDAVLLDARMPRRSGFEVASYLIKNPGQCGAVLLLMPAPFRKGDDLYCDRLGVAARVAKPVRRAELLLALYTALASPSAIPAQNDVSQPPSRLLPSCANGS